jgi:hypothetical protein
MFFNGRQSDLLVNILWSRHQYFFFFYHCMFVWCTHADYAQPPKGTSTRRAKSSQRLFQICTWWRAGSCALNRSSKTDDLSFGAPSGNLPSPRRSISYLKQIQILPRMNLPLSNVRKPVHYFAVAPSTASVKLAHDTHLVHKCNDILSKTSLQCSCFSRTY